MLKQKFLRGCALIAIALFFGTIASTYSVGHFVHAGPGMFPLLISAAVGIIGLVMIVQSRFEADVPMRGGLRNVLIVLASLVGFVLIAKHLNLLVAIAYLVFVSTLAGTDYSIGRNVKITVVLMLVAAAFRYLLGLQLPLA
jgi:hypothetical protein